MKFQRVVLVSLLLPALAQAQFAAFDPGTSAQKVKASCDAAIQGLQKAMNEIRALPLEKVSFANTVLKLEAQSTAFYDLIEITDSLQYLALTQEARDAALACETSKRKLRDDQRSDEALFARIKLAKAEARAEEALKAYHLTAFDSRFFSLSSEARAEVKALEEKVRSLQEVYQKEYQNEARAEIFFTREELTGLTDEELKRFQKQDDGRYRVNTRDWGQLDQVLLSSNPETRRKAFNRYFERGKNNIPTMTEIMAGRREIAQKLGYSSWADRSLNRGETMASETQARELMEALVARVAEGSRAHFAELLKLKQEEEPGATAVYTWDSEYYEKAYSKKYLQFDSDEVKNYFPLDRVLAKMLEIYGKLFGIEFRRVRDAQVWADGVALYRVFDLRDQRPIAYVYTDLLFREGKASNANANTLKRGRMGPDGQYVLPVSLLASSYPKVEGKKTLLQFDQVVTLFHELGHIVHQTLTRAPYASLSGSNVKRDFVEAPSQLLENWLWNYDLVRDLSGHSDDQTRKLPRDLFDRVHKAEVARRASDVAMQLVYALYDLEIHSSRPLDLVQSYVEIRERVMGQPTTQNTVYLPGVHMWLVVYGYDSTYYGYTWSKVKAMDLFSRFKQEGLLNEKLGMEYRKKVLEPGAMRDPALLIEDFLGRPSKPDTFLEWVSEK